MLPVCFVLYTVYKKKTYTAKQMDDVNEDKNTLDNLKNVIQENKDKKEKKKKKKKTQEQSELRGNLFVLLYVDAILTSLYLGIVVTFQNNYLYWLQLTHVINMVVSITAHVLVYPENARIVNACKVFDTSMLVLDVLCAIVLLINISTIKCGAYCFDIQYYYILFIILLCMLIGDILILQTRRALDVEEELSYFEKEDYVYKPLPLLYVLYTLLSILLVFFEGSFFAIFFTPHLAFILTYTLYPRFKYLVMCIFVGAFVCDLVCFFGIRNHVSNVVAIIFSLFYLFIAILLDIRVAGTYAWWLFNSDKGQEIVISVSKTKKDN